MNVRARLAVVNVAGWIGSENVTSIVDTGVSPLGIGASGRIVGAVVSTVEGGRQGVEIGGRQGVLEVEPVCRAFAVDMDLERHVLEARVGKQMGREPEEGVVRLGGQVPLMEIGAVGSFGSRLRAGLCGIPGHVADVGGGAGDRIVLVRRDRQHVVRVGEVRLVRPPDLPVERHRLRVDQAVVVGVLDDRRDQDVVGIRGGRALLERRRHSDHAVARQDAEDVWHGADDRVAVEVPDGTDRGIHRHRVVAGRRLGGRQAGDLVGRGGELGDRDPCRERQRRADHGGNGWSRGRRSRVVRRPVDALKARARRS